MHVFKCCTMWFRVSMWSKYSQIIMHIQKHNLLVETLNGIILQAASRLIEWIHVERTFKPSEGELLDIFLSFREDHHSHSFVCIYVQLQSRTDRRRQTAKADDVRLQSGSSYLSAVGMKSISIRRTAFVSSLPTPNGRNRTECWCCWFVNCALEIWANWNWNKNVVS